MLKMAYIILKKSPAGNNLKIVKCDKNSKENQFTQEQSQHFYHDLNLQNEPNKDQFDY